MMISDDRVEQIIDGETPRMIDSATVSTYTFSGMNFGDPVSRKTYVTVYCDGKLIECYEVKGSKFTVEEHKVMQD